MKQDFTDVVQPIFNIDVQVNVFMHDGHAGGENQGNIVQTPIKETALQATRILVKGKEKVLLNYDFNNDGLMSQEVIKILDGGKLLGIFKVFGKIVLWTHKL